MPNIIHRIGTDKATIKQVYDAISTVDGLASWWTTNILGESKVGSTIQFLFPNEGPDFVVMDLQPPTKVEWKCIQGPKEWIDTHIKFNISDENDEIVLLFKHCGWREEVEFMNHCSTQWAYFLIGLKKFLDSGKGTPYGGDFAPISQWGK